MCQCKTGWVFLVEDAKNEGGKSAYTMSSKIDWRNVLNPSQFAVYDLRFGTSPATSFRGSALRLSAPHRAPPGTQTLSPELRIKNCELRIMNCEL